MSKAIALEFVRQLLSRGYTADQAEHESCMGYDRCDDSDYSYIIRTGTITVPTFGGQNFRFRTLANELSGSKREPRAKPRRATPRFEQLELL